jgi:hypothetical protein
MVLKTEGAFLLKTDSGAATSRVAVGCERWNGLLLPCGIMVPTGETAS